jgi:phosphoribosylanthranilate isomerase
MVKICGITRREDAEVAVDAGASAIGFIFYPPSPRYIEPARAAELGAGLNVLKVGVFVNEAPANVEAVARAAKLDVVQLYGGESPEGLRVWRAFRVNEGVDWTQPAEAVLLDGPKNGVVFDWTQAQQIRDLAGGGTTYFSKIPPARWFPPAGSLPVVIAGGLDHTNVANAIHVTHAWGVDASSKLETAPGVKDHDKIRLFIDAAKKAGA